VYGFIGQLLLEFSKRFVDKRYFSGRKFTLGFTPSFNHDQVNGKPCPLFSVEITPDGKMLCDVVLAVEEVVESAALSGVVPF
jgi:hypothetical protein